MIMSNFEGSIISEKEVRGSSKTHMSAGSHRDEMDSHRSGLLLKMDQQHVVRGKVCGVQMGCIFNASSDSQAARKCKLRISSFCVAAVSWLVSTSSKKYRAVEQYHPFGPSLEPWVYHDGWCTVERPSSQS